MTRAVSSIDRFAWRGVSFEGWLFGIHRHVVTDTQRATARKGSGDVADRASADTPVLDALVREDDLSAVRAAFAQLDPDDREVLELRVVARLSADDAARVLGKRPGAVRMAQSRALERLRKLLDAAEASTGEDDR